ncbi:hypothetical protein [Halobacillus mangrovi]|uniref:hypothetical protein n=1 Tax=Halobacillus mangrovi TaxID=402384 RepID=UPI003D969797
MNFQNKQSNDKKRYNQWENGFLAIIISQTFVDNILGCSCYRLHYYPCPAFQKGDVSGTDEPTSLSLLPFTYSFRSIIGSYFHGGTNIEFIKKAPPRYWLSDEERWLLY